MCTACLPACPQHGNGGMLCCFCAGRREQPSAHLANLRSFDSLPASPRGHQLSSSPKRVPVPQFAASKGQLSPRPRAAQVTQSLDGASALFGTSAERVVREAGSLQQVTWTELRSAERRLSAAKRELAVTFEQFVLCC